MNWTNGHLHDCTSVWKCTLTMGYTRIVPNPRFDERICLVKGDRNWLKKKAKILAGIFCWLGIFTWTIFLLLTDSPMPHDLLKDWIEMSGFSVCWAPFFAAVMENWKTQPAGAPLPPGGNMAITRSCKFSFMSNIFMGCCRDYDNERQLRYSNVGTHVCSVCFYGDGAFDWSCCSGHLQSRFPLRWGARAGCCLCCSLSRRPRWSCIELPWSGRHPDGRHLLKDAWSIHLVFNVDILWWKCPTI